MGGWVGGLGGGGGGRAGALRLDDIIVVRSIYHSKELQL